MIGNLGMVDYSTATILDGNNGNDGNIACNPLPELDKQKQNLFPLPDIQPGTTGSKYMMVTSVPDHQNRTGNNSNSINAIENQSVNNPIPVVPDVPAKKPETIKDPNPIVVPKGRGIWKLSNIVGERTKAATERKICYCCKGNDFWLAGTGDYPHWVCRKCHSPAPGSERTLTNDTMRPSPHRKT